MPAPQGWVKNANGNESLLFYLILGLLSSYRPLCDVVDCVAVAIHQWMIIPDYWMVVDMYQMHTMHEWWI